jgi:hypothetical protein
MINNQPATEREFAEWATDALMQYADDDGTEIHVSNFDDAGLLTNNTGIIVTMPHGGAEFQLTIVQSQQGDPEPEPDASLERAFDGR